MTLRNDICIKTIYHKNKEEGKRITGRLDWSKCIFDLNCGGWFMMYDLRYALNWSITWNAVYFRLIVLDISRLKHILNLICKIFYSCTITFCVIKNTILCWTIFAFLLINFCISHSKGQLICKVIILFSCHCRSYSYYMLVWVNELIFKVDLFMNTKAIWIFYNKNKMQKLWSYYKLFRQTI